MLTIGSTRSFPLNAEQSDFLSLLSFSQNKVSIDIFRHLMYHILTGGFPQQKSHGGFGCATTLRPCTQVSYHPCTNRNSGPQPTHYTTGAPVFTTPNFQRVQRFRGRFPHFRHLLHALFLAGLLNWPHRTSHPSLFRGPSRPHGKPSGLIFQKGRYGLVIRHIVKSKAKNPLPA